MIGSHFRFPSPPPLFEDMEFEEYFSFEAIAGDLIRWRVAGKGVRGEDGRTDVEAVMPPRRLWSRAGAKARKRVDPADVRRQAIWRAVMREQGRDSTGWA